jgi:predicted ATPase
MSPARASSALSAQGRLFELLLGVLERLSVRAPVLFVVEDLHWSDRSTRDLLGFLVRNLRDSDVMLLLTYRSDELHRRHPLLPFLAELERTGRVERIELHPFDRRESADQLRAIAGHDLTRP